MNYTTINHDARMNFGLSCNDYCIADKIYHLSNNPKNNTRWCYAGREAIGRMFGISRQSVITIIKTLVAKNLVEIHPETDHLRTTEIWYRNFTPCKETLHPPVKKVDIQVSNNFTPPCKETLRPSYNKSLEEEVEQTNAGKPAHVSDFPFDSFWEAYGKKLDRPKCEKKWNLLSEGVKKLIMADIPRYRASLEDVKYQKYPLTYLNGENWKDERTVQPLPNSETPKRRMVI